MLQKQDRYELRSVIKVLYMTVTRPRESIGMIEGLSIDSAMSRNLTWRTGAAARALNTGAWHIVAILGSLDRCRISETAGNNFGRPRKLDESFSRSTNLTMCIALAGAAP